MLPTTASPFMQRRTDALALKRGNAGMSCFRLEALHDLVTTCRNQLAGRRLNNTKGISTSLACMPIHRQQYTDYPVLSIVNAKYFEGKFDDGSKR